MELKIYNNPMNEYKTSLRRKTIHQAVVTRIENHSPFGKPMQCAVVALNNGLKGIIHENHFDKQKYRSLVGFLDHKIDFMVLDVTKYGLDAKEIEVFDEETGVVLLSRVQALEELEEDFWNEANIDHVCTGTVSGFEDQRLYLLVKGVTCILPIRDYEYDWTPSAKNLIPLGTEITAKITEIDKERRRVVVSRKELMEDPWLRVRQEFKIGDFAAGEITSIDEKYGIFIKLAPGVESLAWFPPKIPSHKELIGMKVSVKIKNVNPDKRKIRTEIVHFPHVLY